MKNPNQSWGERYHLICEIGAMRKQYEDISRNSSVDDDNDNLKLGKEFDDEKLKRTCTVCGHVFKSKKAVHGHMKTHPERGWRGMKEVPAAAAAAASATAHRSSASSSSSGGGVVVEKNYGRRPLFLSWSVTAKRGRKCINIASTASACSASNYSAVLDTEIIREKEIDHPSHHHNIGSSKRKIDKLSDTFDKINKGQMKVDIDEYLVEAEDQNKNKNKNVKNVILRKEYHCDMCHKTFLSPQALGGHKSSHYKPNKTEPPQLNITQSDQMPRPNKILDFDLNEIPPEENIGF